jgi:hypothetical protein
MYVTVAVAAIILIPAFIITILDVILDVGLNPFIHLDFLHTLIVFPIMLGFIHLRFDIQKRNEMDFYFFAFTDYEEKLIKKMGYRFEEDIDFYEEQNLFGAKRERVSCTTTVYNKVVEE